jgi:hypothetical protein
MSRRTRRLCRIVVLALAALAAMALPALASATTVTVRVVGQRAELLAARSVTLGEGGRDALGWNGERMPVRCPNDSAYQALELAVRGEWDRAAFATTILGERHVFSPNEEMWITYDRNITSALWHYAEYGLCELRMPNGSSLLMQAGRSGPSPTFIPDAVPLELERTTPREGNINVGARLTVHATKWKPTDIFGREDGRGHFVIEPSPATNAVGYTIEGIETRPRTDASGNATLTFSRAGRFRLQASMPGSETDWSRSQFIDICVEGGRRTC